MERKFSHIGIPTNEEKAWDGFFEPAKIHFTDFNKDEYGIEWVKFEDDSPWPEQVRTMPHIAYQVNDIEGALVGKQVLVEIFSPSEGVRVAFINVDGAVIEFMEITASAP